MAIFNIVKGEASWLFRDWVLLGLTVCVGLSVFVSLAFLLPPTHFPHDYIVRIEKGSDLSSVAKILSEQGLVRSRFWFKVAVIVSSGHGAVVAGDYHFANPQGLLSIAHRLTSSDFRLDPIRVTIPEGLSVFQMADMLAPRLPFFDPQAFVEMAPEGYLFPDTYFLLPNASEQDVIDNMQENFEMRTAELYAETRAQGKEWNEIVIMASLIEEEAKHDEDRPLVSSVLHNRLLIDMALQVDATFSYVNGKNSYTLSHEDLLDESPYNSYQNIGLPPTPIANPGIKSLEAALHPADTKYLYFLSDLSGNMYYAEDFEGHQRNRELYLRR